MLAYAISVGIIFNNPAAAIEARYITQATSRDVALTAEEIGILLRGIYTSNMNRRHKLALHLLIICMVRKSELIEATWSEVNFNALEWRIPGERMKMDNPHIVPLSKQALAMFEELKFLAGDSPYVFPSRHGYRRPISKTTLNCAVRTQDLNVRDFVIHDFRRTASTLLHEQGYNSDWIEIRRIRSAAFTVSTTVRSTFSAGRCFSLGLILLMRRLRLEGRLSLDNSGSLTM